MDEEKITVSFEVTVKPEPGLTAQDKEAAMKDIAIAQVTGYAANYDWGIAVVGSVSSTCSATVPIDESQPDYVEE